MSKKLIMGNEAFAHAALEAGVRVVAGYPGTPSSEVIETVAKLHAAGSAEGVHVEWSSNEAVALGLIAGAAYTGARTLFTCKQVGLNVASDPLMSLNYVGVKGGTVILVADDPGPISSQTEQDTRRFVGFAKIPVFDPASPEQGFAMMKAAYEVSERHGTPVIFRPTTRVCHASAFMDVADETKGRPVPEEGFVKDPKWVIFPPRAYAGHKEINDRLAAIAEEFSRGEYGDFNPVFEGGGVDGEQPRIGIVAGGISAAYAREALRSIEEQPGFPGLPVPAYRFMQIGTPYPFPADAVREFADGLDDIIVFEELDHVLEDELLKLAGAEHLSYEVHGKLDGSTLTRGENSTDVIAMQLRSFLFNVDYDVAPPGPVLDTPLPVRPPVLCAGCPHRGSFYACKRAIGKRPVEYSGDIGCYTLGNAAPLHTTDTCLCMGAGITMAQGFAVTQPGAKHLAFVGDSTFFASGLAGAANAVYNQHDITIVVLDNSTTAMTGSQPHPGTGQTLMGPKAEPISIPRVLEALGYECIVEANPFDLEEATAAARETIDFEGPSALIFKGPCIQLVKPAPALVVDQETCTRCKKCIREIGCPAIFNDPGDGSIRIDASLCTGCGLCTGVCPFGSIGPASTDEGGAR
ncbi:MAG: thiamine pyrophosphate-dependent enzyme [Coriobacteriales bacterium]|jgi:indolepyruvate ferredoxin oxidoreductase alpha subunit